MFEKYFSSTWYFGIRIFVSKLSQEYVLKKKCEVENFLMYFYRLLTDLYANLNT